MPTQYNPSHYGVGNVYRRRVRFALVILDDAEQEYCRIGQYKSKQQATNVGMNLGRETDWRVRLIA